MQYSVLSSCLWRICLVYCYLRPLAWQLFIYLQHSIPDWAPSDINGHFLSIISLFSARSYIIMEKIKFVSFSTTDHRVSWKYKLFWFLKTFWMVGWFRRHFGIFRITNNKIHPLSISRYDVYIFILYERYMTGSFSQDNLRGILDTS